MPYQDVGDSSVRMTIAALFRQFDCDLLQVGHQKPATRGNLLPQVASAEPLIWKVFELIP